MGDGSVGNGGGAVSEGDEGKGRIHGRREESTRRMQDEEGGGD